MIDTFISNQRTACARSVSVCLHVYSHINGIRSLSQQHDLRSCRPGFTPNSNLIYPFPLRAMLHVVQSLPHFSVKMKPTSCHTTCFPSTPLLEEGVVIVFAATKCPPTVDARSCAQRNKSYSPAPHEIWLVPPTLNAATHCPSAAWFRQVTRATPNPGHTTSSDLCPPTTCLDSPGSISSFPVSRCSRQVQKLVFSGPQSPRPRLRVEVLWYIAALPCASRLPASLHRGTSSSSG